MRDLKQNFLPQEEQVLDLEVVDFTDLEQLEESIAPIFLAVAAAGGTCSGGKGSGCTCVVPAQ